MTDRVSEIYPGDKVLVYDPWANGRQGAFREATVLMRYGYVSRDMMRILGWDYKTAQYPDCIDVQFSDRISKGHFTHGVRRIDGPGER